MVYCYKCKNRYYCQSVAERENGKLANTYNDCPVYVEDEVENDDGLMTPEQFEVQMRELARTSRDEEVFHIDADDMIIALLRSLGYGAGCDIFEETPKWYS